MWKCRHQSIIASVNTYIRGRRGRAIGYANECQSQKEKEQNQQTQVQNQKGKEIENRYGCGWCYIRGCNIIKGVVSIG